MKLRIKREQVYIGIAVLFLLVAVQVLGWRGFWGAVIGALRAAGFVLIIVVVVLALLVAVVYIARLSRRKVPLDAPEFRDFVLKQLAVIRPLGFFEEYAGKTDEEAADLLIQRIENEYGDEVAELMKYPALLASADTSRILCEDLENDWFQGNDLYIRLLNRIAEIARGKFQPTEIVENWSEAGDSVTIRFNLNGEGKTLTPKVNGDWLDPNLFWNIDKMIASTGYNFLMPDYPAGQDILLVVLNAEERKRLNEEAGWLV